MQTRRSPNIQTLHRLARHASLTDFENLSKSELYRCLKDYYDIARLARSESRNFVKEKVTTKRKSCTENDIEINEASNVPKTQKVKVQLNKLDPILFAPITKKNTFKFIRPNGTAVVFNIESLVDYLIISGDFTDPETRLPFSDENLKEIDEIATKANLGKKSVFEAKQNKNLYNDAKFRRDALLGLERLAGEVVTDMLDIIETYDPDEAQLELAMKEFPSFQDYYKQIKEADPEYASKCMAHWKLFMKGPPNHPNIDEYGLIKVVCTFLRNCE